MSKKVEHGNRATYDDLIALPENMVGEIVDGELFASPRPAPRHAVAASALGGELYGPFQVGRGGPGGWWILDEPELHLGPDVLVPDLAGWRRERLPKLPDTAYFEQAPDWVCEVISPATGRLDRIRKVRIYAREGIGHAWLVDRSSDRSRPFASKAADGPSSAPTRRANAYGPSRSRRLNSTSRRSGVLDAAACVPRAAEVSSDFRANHLRERTANARKNDHRSEPA